MKSFAVFLLLATCVLVASDSNFYFPVWDRMVDWRNKALSDKNSEDYPIVQGIDSISDLYKELIDKYEDQPEKQPILYYKLSKDVVEPKDMFEYIPRENLSEEEIINNEIRLKLLFFEYTDDILTKLRQHSVGGHDYAYMIFRLAKNIKWPIAWNNAKFWDILSHLHAYIGSLHPQDFISAFDKLPIIINV
ncbi:uncharacterized protein LOC106655942 [Trichogramma pretiosum]|uniref:uncharacterized protein LOC106655942 n=1 Tax=Trichogramma pretiosum TaxID=7493 RepID=UPI0006C9B9FF|nr:uncharacterized protein LOC106655942 [Trichogramma pretiosum]